VFYGRFAMHSDCPDCGVQFEREPGYFFGAMYFSYAIGVIMISVFAMIAYWTLRLEPQWCALVGWLVFLPFTPAVFRYSRVLWMHFDRTFDPDDQSEHSVTGLV
jgi:hypothetical protein